MLKDCVRTRIVQGAAVAIILSHNDAHAGRGTHIGADKAGIHPRLLKQMAQAATVDILTQATGKQRAATQIGRAHV